MTGAGEPVRPRGRLLPASSAARMPFVVLIVVLLGSGLIGLLVLNSAVNQDSFQLSKLQRDTTRLTDEQQALQQDIDGFSDPRELAKHAEKLGMVPGGNPAFITPDGRLRGVPGGQPESPDALLLGPPRLIPPYSAAPAAPRTAPSGTPGAGR
jgi:cell division protein FtsB